jgi:hypothetical protein
MNRGLPLCIFVTLSCTGARHSPAGGGDGSVLRDGASEATTAREAGASGDSGGGKGRHGAVRDSGRLPVDASSDGSIADGSTMDSGDATAVALDFSASVLERNKRPSRDGAFVEPTFTLKAAAGLVKETAFTANFTGQMFASPLYLERGPDGKGVFFVVTSSNDVLALDETAGAVVWQQSIGSAPARSGSGCGSVLPIGIISTPIIDAATGTLYVAGGVGTATIERHEIHALSVMDGSERPGYPIVVGGTSGTTTFTPAVQNQRSALSLVNGILYVAYGGHSGDCGAYHGWVFAVDTKNPKRTGAWATLGQGEGIWGAGGMPSDGDGVFAITGNNTARTPDHVMSDSEEVVRITALAQLSRTNKNIYFPGTWLAMNNADADFGASGPVYMSAPGSTPDHLLAAVAKNGTFYLLDPANLGGMDGHLAELVVSTGTVRGGLAAYTSATGLHVLMATDNRAVCATTSPTGRAVVSLLITPGAPPKPTFAWCVAIAGSLVSPVTTTTDGAANPIVWFVNDNLLNGYDGDTGALVYSGGKDMCVGVRQWTTAIVAKGRIIVGADAHLCAWSLPH